MGAPNLLVAPGLRRWSNHVVRRARYRNVASNTSSACTTYSLARANDEHDKKRSIRGFMDVVVAALKFRRIVRTIDGAQ